MSYKLEWNPSPNFTPGSQTQAIYGQPRSIKFGAGHWWNTPEAGATHAGVVSIFKNPARQGSAHAVLSDAWVTEMVRSWDTAWTTNNANPYTYSIEVDPRIMWKWQAGVTASQRALGERIFETLAEYIADKGYHNLTWHPHNYWWQTQCNPIRWNEVMIRAKQIYAAKHAPAPAIKWVPMDTPRKMVVLQDLKVYDLKAQKYIGDTIKKGTIIDLKTKTPDSKWLRSAYSTQNNIDNGVERDKMGEVPVPDPEWVKNLKSITPVKLQVLAAAAPIYDLNNVSKQVGSPIPQGTWIDFTKQTVVGGKTYLISKYSAENAMPNGILKDHVGIPAPKPDPIPEPPKPQPEPTWLDKWEDIADIKMYTRKADVEVVNLLDGTTTTTIKGKGTEIEIASSTEWMGQKYLITKYSTDKKLPHGIRLVDLDIKPVDDNTDPIPEDPDQPVDDLIKENNTLLKQILALLQKIWDTITGK